MKARQNLKIAGTSPRRLDGVEKVTGAAVYTGDLELPGMGFAKILRSPAPHAKILKIDARKAESLPGVFTVLTRAGWRVTVLKLSLVLITSFTGRRAFHESAAAIGSALT